MVRAMLGRIMKGKYTALLLLLLQLLLLLLPLKYLQLSAAGGLFSGISAPNEIMPY